MTPREFPTQQIDLPVILVLPLMAIRESGPGILERAKDRQANKTYYYCPYCLGWLEGDPSKHEEDTTATCEQGRLGTVYQCRKCMNEVAFIRH